MGRTFATTDSGNAGSSASVDALGTGAFTQIHLIRRLTTDATSQVIACKPFAGATGWACVLDQVSSTYGCLRLRLCRATTNTDYISDTAGAIAQSTTQWVAAVYGSASASRLLKRGLAAGAFTEVAYSTAVQGSGTYNADDTASLIIGNSAAGTTPFSGNIYVSAFFPSALTNAEIQEWCDKQRPSMFSPTAWWYIGLADPEADQSGNGITLDISGTSIVADVETPYVITSGQIADTGTPSDQTTYLLYSAAARISYTLAAGATEVDVAMQGTYSPVTFGGEDVVGLWRNTGSGPTYLGNIAAPGDAAGAGRASLTGLTLNAGDVVTLLSGCRQKGPPIVGTWPVTARFWNGTTPVAATITSPPAATNRRAVVSGYSTAMEMATPQHELAWPMQWRLQNERRLLLDAKGGQSLFDEGPDAGTRTTYAATLAALGGNVYWLEGWGDFITNQWSAANYQTALSDMLTKLLSAAPLAKLVMVSVHELQSSDETTPNSFGNVVPDYRTAEAAVVASIASPRLTYVNGFTALLGWTPGAYTTDGRHPNDAGHTLKYTTYGPMLSELLLPGAGIRDRGGDHLRRRV